jgi:endoglucanase
VIRIPFEIAVLVAVAAATVSCLTPVPMPAYPASEVCPAAPSVPGDALPAALIDDAEDGDAKVVQHDGRSGIVSSVIDPDSALVVGPTGSPRRPLPILGGANGSRCAWNLRGTLSNRPIAFAALGINMTNPKAFYDASRFAGISFYARRSAGTSARVRVSVSDWNTDSDGGVCTKCFNYFGQEIELSETWTRYTLPFESLRQLPGWGVPRPRQIDPSRIFQMMFGVLDRGAPFDVWLDDVAFMERTPPPSAPPLPAPPLPGPSPIAPSQALPD